VAAAAAVVASATWMAAVGSRVDAAPGSTTTAAVAASAPVVLPAAAAVGQKVAVDSQINHSTGAGSFQLLVSMSTSVTAVNGDGSYTTRSTISAIEVPDGAEVAGNAVNNLVSQSFEQSFAGNGAAIPQASTLINAATMPADQQAAGASVVDAVSMVWVGFPAEPVTVGMAWTTPGTVGSHGIEIPVTYQCALTAISDSTYTMSVSYTQGFSHAADDGVIEATIAGAGTIVGSLSNPLIMSATVNQTVDGIQGAAPLHSDTSIHLNAAPATG
jgi:hypothetical protein